MKQIPTEIIESGKPFFVKFHKRGTGEVRVMNCTTDMSRHAFTGKGMGKEKTPAQQALLVVFDLQKNGVRSIPLDSIIEVSETELK